MVARGGPGRGVVGCAAWCGPDPGFGPAVRNSEAEVDTGGFGEAKLGLAASWDGKLARFGDSVVGG